MKLNNAVALALLCAAPAFMAPASAALLPFAVDFERSWDYANGDVADYYNGGAAADGSTGGANLGLAFKNISGLSNDSAFTYYSNAVSPLGVAYAHGGALGDKALINAAAGLANGLRFYYASPSAVAGALTVWSGLDGTGTLLASLDLAANASAAYDTWTQAEVRFDGVARSFDFSAAADVLAIDNLTSVPEPGSLALVALAIAGLALRRRATR